MVHYYNISPIKYRAAQFVIIKSVDFAIGSKKSTLAIFNCLVIIFGIIINLY